uniref:TrbG/VirB9 family P-type conjugative transfer protein n=1 Tax=Parerythrobacter lutipelagi TaxID=1964208 RepID=UPI0010F7D391|nr:TrbG/VirB9 family P-type conjugative transfer protein [Parerythrobacter lutipelagi]
MIRAGLPAPSLALAALVLLAAPAMANDPRLVERLYDPNTVVRIEGQTKVQATIKFGENEQIENVAIGDSTAWQVTPNKRANLLFVKPLSPSAATNMTVITNRRTYLFDLVASPRAKPLYVLTFTYAEEPEEPEMAGVVRETASSIELAAATDPYAVVDPAELNFQWEREGVRQLLPSQAYDNGAATFLTWPSGQPVPAILVKDEAGTEGPVNFVVRGDLIVVEGVPREIILRSGEDSATLTNTGPIRSVRTPASSAFAQSGR